MASELAKALAAVQADIPHVDTTSSAQVPGGRVHKYADLADVTAAIMPLLGKNGLAFTASPTMIEGRFVLAYSLLHESGESIDGEYPLPEKATPHQIGSHLTYARRYILTAITGLAPGGEDDDGNAAQQEVHMDRARTPARPPSDVPSRPVTPGPRAGPELEQLRDGAVVATPGDRRAQRAKRPAEQDEWTDQPPGQLPKPPDKTIGGIQAHFKRLGIMDRDIRLGYTARLAGLRALGSTNDLTKKQAAMVLQDLGRCRDEKALRALLDRGDAPPDDLAPQAAAEDGQDDGDGDT